MSSHSQMGNPFLDAATTFMPLSVTGMLRHAEFFAVTLDVIRAAYSRMAAYFLTDLDVIGDMGDDERKDQKNFFIYDFGMWPYLLTAGVSTLVYGNAYLSVIAPIRRTLFCPKCKATHSIQSISKGKPGKVTWEKRGFHATCPACGREGRMPHQDHPDRSRPPVWRVWNPHDVQPADYDEWTGRPTAFAWAIPSDVRQDVKSGRPGILSNAPVGVLEAAATTGWFQFAPWYIHHWADTPLPGLRSRGIGVPRAITSYRTFFLLQLLRRQNEVIATNHVTPFRVVSPAPAGKDPEGGDLIRSTSLGPVVGNNFFRMLDVHRRDPAAWHFSPAPLEYQAFGADANALVPKDLTDQVYDQALNGIGMPVEMYKMSLSAQQAPVGIRLFERFNAPFFHGLNGAAEFAAQRCCDVKAMQPSVARLVPPKLADDIEQKQILFQLAQMGKGSWDDFFQTIGKNFEDVVRKTMEEQKTLAEAQAKFQQDAAEFGIAAQIAQPPQPGQGPGEPQSPGQGQGQQDPNAPPAGPVQMDIPPANQPIDANELDQRAQDEAKQLAMADPAQRQQRLTQIRQANPVYHGLVRHAMEKLRSAGRSAGQQAGIQQVVQGGGQPQGQ